MMAKRIVLASRQVAGKGAAGLADANCVEGPGAVMIVYCASALPHSPEGNSRWSAIGTTEALLTEPRIIGASCDGAETSAEATDTALSTLIRSWGRTYGNDRMRMLDGTSTPIVADDYLPPKSVVPWAMVAETTDTDAMPWRPLSYIVPRAMRGLPANAVTDDDALAIPFDGSPPTLEVAYDVLPATSLDIYPWIRRQGPRADLNHPVADMLAVAERIWALGDLLGLESRDWRLARRRAEDPEEASDALISDLWVGTTTARSGPKRLYIAEWDAMAGPLVASGKTPLDNILASAHGSPNDLAILIAKRASADDGCAYYPNIRTPS